MKNLHVISKPLTEIQLGIINYYYICYLHRLKKVVFYGDGRVETNVGRPSWARWNNGDWISYIKNIDIRPLSELNIKVELR